MYILFLVSNDNYPYKKEIISTLNCLNLFKNLQIKCANICKMVKSDTNNKIMWLYSLQLS